MATTEAYALLRRHVEAIGHPIPSNDLWIAALAYQHDLPILSRDSDFDYIDAVERVSW